MTIFSSSRLNKRRDNFLKELIRGRSLDVIDDEGLNWAFCRIKFQTRLLLNCVQGVTNPLG